MMKNNTDLLSFAQKVSTGWQAIGMFEAMKGRNIFTQKRLPNYFVHNRLVKLDKSHSCSPSRTPDVRKYRIHFAVNATGSVVTSALAAMAFMTLRDAGKLAGPVLTVIGAVLLAIMLAGSVTFLLMARRSMNEFLDASLNNEFDRQYREKLQNIFGNILVPALIILVDILVYLLISKMP